MTVGQICRPVHASNPEHCAHGRDRIVHPLNRKFQKTLRLLTHIEAAQCELHIPCARSDFAPGCQEIQQKNVNKRGVKHVQAVRFELYTRLSP